MRLPAAREPAAPAACYNRREGQGIERVPAMKHRLGWAALLLCLCALGPLVLGQGAPAQIDSALQDLSAKLGYAVGIGNLSSWRWEQTTYPDSALGCTTAAGEGGALLAYRFRLEHNGLTHDYRVSADSAVVVYCGSLSPDEPGDAPDAAYSNRLCAADASGGPYMRSRARAGMDAQILGGFLNLRGQPAATAQVMLQIPPGYAIRLTAGPDCVDGYLWWLAIVDGQTGYIAEAGDGAYFIEPLPPPAMPSREILNPSVVPYLLEFGQIRGNFQPAQAWSADGRYLALPGARGSDALWLYDMSQPVLKPTILPHDAGLTVLAFRPRHAQIAFGSETGVLRLWQLDGESPTGYSERLYLNAHAGPVSAIAFSPDGERLVSAGPRAYTHLTEQRDWAAIVWDLPTVGQAAALTGHSGWIRAIAFAPYQPFILTGGDDSAQRFHFAAGGGLARALESGAPLADLAYSPDGALLALALRRSADNLLIYDGAGAARIASYPLPTNGVTSLAFSPDGAMLAVGAAEGIFSLWDARTHQLLTTRETDGGVADIQFSPDGSLISVATEKQALVFFGLPLGSG